jgi:hypothetical protein
MVVVCGVRAIEILVVEMYDDEISRCLAVVFARFASGSIPRRELQCRVHVAPHR